MKKSFLAAFLVSMIFIEVSCALVTPRALRKGWNWDGVFRVMPNSIFEPVARAKDAGGEFVTAAPAPGASLREEMSLDGAWRYFADAGEKGETEKWFAPGFNDSSWKTMKVPNNYSIDDFSLKNFYGPVWFRRGFTLPESFEGKNLRLNFEGVDYFAKVWLNGELLGEHEGYFNPFNFEITAKVKPGINVLTVKVTNPWDYSMEQSEHLWVHMAEKIWVKGIFTYHDSRMGGVANSAKDAQSFGTGGIYRPVKIVATGDVAIDWILITPRLSDNYTKAEVSFDVFLTNFSGNNQEALVQIETVGENFSGYKDIVAAKTLLAPGPNKVRLLLKVADPKLWWPYSHPELGRPNLYRMNATVLSGKKAADNRSEVFGIKEVKLTETGSEAYFWKVNGKRMFFRGTNGIPTQYYSRLTPEYLDDYFRKLKENNLDILIVHDHQAPPEVYEKADREGMVLLQNFTLIWEISACDFIRPNGDPKLTGNEEVVVRMATEGLWYLYNHPSIFWWSLHDESNHFAFNGKGLLPGNFCKKTPYQQGDFMPVFIDMTMNLNLDNQLLKAAHAINPTIPFHRTGGMGTESTLWWGWYHGTYFDLIKKSQPFPLEYGSEAVPYSMAKAMSYFKNIFPPTKNKAAVAEWEYHSMEFPVHETYMGRSNYYDNFNDWAFASQLYQATVVKYHTETNRENKYHPTGSILQYMYNEWWPSVNFGFTDWNLEDKISLSWMKSVFTPQLAATRVDHNIHSQREKIELPIHLMNDQYIDFKAAKVSWRIVEETDSFFIKGHAKPTIENRNPPNALTAAVGHRIPKAEVSKGEFVVDLPADSHLVAGIVKFDAPRTKEPRHYTIYLTLASADGKILCENWDHFVVVENASTFKTPEGISPNPRFSLSMKLAKSGKPFAGSEVAIVDKYSPNLKYQAKLDSSGAAVIKDMLPGAYRLSVGDENYEFLLNRDENLEVNFTPGLKTTLGVKPLIEWKELQRVGD